MITQPAYKLWNIFVITFSLVFFSLIISYADTQAQKKQAVPVASLKKTSSAKKQPGFKTIITNFDESGAQLTRFNTLGEAIDAHDGEIAFFKGVYYLYGTSYGCGFEWKNTTAPFCGFKTYSSTDLVNWTDRGFLFDPTTSVWQSRCNGNTYGCFRPHVIYNKKTGLYVLWINVYDNSVGFRVFTSKSPFGEFTEVAEPRLAINSDAAVAGLNNGDHDTFVDDDGTGYVVYTDWHTKGTLVIERLSPDYLTGTGMHVEAVTPGKTEAPALFKRNGIYYVTYSDPNCGYCSGTGTSYRTATSPLGPWSEGILISNNSCGGQPSFVSPIKLSSGMIYLYGSDLWNNAAKNEALANYYWAPLSFAPDGSINKMECQSSVTLALASGSKANQPNKKDLDNSAGNDGFKKGCDINKNIQRCQSFIATRTGILTKILFTSFKNAYPDAGLQIDVYNANESLIPVGTALYSTLVPADSISWAAKNVSTYPAIAVMSGKRYAIVVQSASSTGCYGFEYKDTPLYPAGGAAISNDNGKSFSNEKNRTLKFETFIAEKSIRSSKTL